ncbi:MAG: hypothetical protein LBK53_03970 [Heliobacteriaceae bacterium]|jgi:hypothetical protein|nr:hypothetical protein [Heliobacteriaceae bacterium]
MNSVIKKCAAVLLLTVMLQASAEEVGLGRVKPPEIEYPANNVKRKESLIINDEQVMREIVKLQREKDLEDIENLWKGTVENNQVIGFAVKKLSTPESKRRIHSSLMAKTLSAIVAGASFAPMVTGGNYLTQTSAFAAGRAAQNFINRKNIPTEIPLTDTELIELAGLVESLQDNIIQAYYNYKSTLSQLKETRAKLLLYSKNYANAMEEEDVLGISVSSALYDNMRIEEFSYTENAKKYHLELQRLAGKKVTDGLNLYQYNYNATLMGGN